MNAWLGWSVMLLLVVVLVLAGVRSNLGTFMAVLLTPAAVQVGAQ